MEDRANETTEITFFKMLKSIQKQFPVEDILFIQSLMRLHGL